VGKTAGSGAINRITFELAEELRYALIEAFTDILDERRNYNASDELHGNHGY
jgi:hypothetical protein